MDKRINKLNRSLSMIMLRISGKETLRQVEIKIGQKISTLTALSDSDSFRTEKGTNITLADLPRYLEEMCSGAERGSIRFVERGAVVTLELLEKDVKVSISTLDSPVQHGPIEFGTRQQFIRAEEAKELLQALEIASPEGKIRADRRRKFYQVDRFVELVDEMLEQWSQERPLVILDCGCGKSYLSFVLNYWLTEKRRIPCRVIGIDDNHAVIESSQKIQRRLGYRNMEFAVSSILQYTPLGPVDMVLSLHACDTATDEALALGLYLNSKYIISVPCCQAALRERLDYSPWQIVTRHSIFRNRMSDLLTDGLRTAALEARGYRVSVVEYVSPLDTPKNIMLRAVHGGSADAGKVNAYKQLQELVEGNLPLEDFLQEIKNR